MKTYKVKKANKNYCDEVSLVNTINKNDCIAGSADDFTIGERVDESNIELLRVPYVDECGVGTAEIAFKKGSLMANFYKGK